MQIELKSKMYAVIHIFQVDPVGWVRVFARQFCTLGLVFDTHDFG